MVASVEIVKARQRESREREGENDIEIDVISQSTLYANGSFLEHYLNYSTVVPVLLTGRNLDKEKALSSDSLRFRDEKNDPNSEGSRRLSRLGPVKD